MMFGQLKEMLAKQVNRSDMESTWYPIWINRALRKIQTDASFTFMRNRVQLTITVGNSSVNMPVDFKELTPEQNPISIIDPTLAVQGPLAELPCELTSRENMIKYRAATFVPSRPQNVRGRLNGLPVYLDRRYNGAINSALVLGLPTLNILDQAGENLTFSVSYYRFLPDLEHDVDFTDLTWQYPDLVENKIKAIAFTALNDPIAASFEALASKLLSEAVLDDKRRLNSGRVYRMGG